MRVDLVVSLYKIVYSMLFTHQKGTEGSTTKMNHGGPGTNNQALEARGNCTNREAKTHPRTMYLTVLSSFCTMSSGFPLVKGFPKAPNNSMIWRI